MEMRASSELQFSSCASADVRDIYHIIARKIVREQTRKRRSLRLSIYQLSDEEDQPVEEMSSWSRAKLPI
jgi:hypothetical protein